MSISVYFCKKATIVKPVDNPVQKFCSEQAVEDILTTYTQENKSASVFLGAKKSKKKNEKREQQPEPKQPVQQQQQQEQLQLNENEINSERKEQKVYRQRQVSRDITDRRRTMSQGTDFIVILVRFLSREQTKICTKRTTKIISRTFCSKLAI